uniref:Kazal-like domain-containing protein n=1 Tax=Electrophorus electricus TaxID=8005 RepID=A0A4W4HGC9_ELEEL
MTATDLLVYLSADKSVLPFIILIINLGTCKDIGRIQACPLSHSPVCGSNGTIYLNECILCVQRFDFLFVKDGSC